MNRILLALVVALFATLWVVGGRMVSLERRLAGVDASREAQAKESGEPHSAMVAAAEIQGGPAAVPGRPARGVTKRDRSEVMALKEEVARLRKELAERAQLRLVRDGMRRLVEGTQEELQGSLSHLGAVPDTVFIPAEPAKVEHWSGGPKRSWGHEQATGAPDTVQAGDIPTAWASKNPDEGVQWLKLDYDRPVDVQEINVVESHQPGAISKVAAVMPDGSETVVWEGRFEASAENERVNSTFPAAEGIHAQSLKVYVDTDRVPGWNEIDAVEMVGRDGSRQWASGSSSSSSYADR